MFGRSKSLVLVAKPAIEQIADALRDAGYKALIADDRASVASAANGYNFNIYLDEPNQWIQFSMAIQNGDVGYTHSDANKFNVEWRCAKVCVANSLVFMQYDFLIINGEIKDALDKHIPLWCHFVSNFCRSLTEAQLRYQAKQEEMKRQPLMITNGGGTQ